MNIEQLLEELRETLQVNGVSHTILLNLLERCRIALSEQADLLRRAEMSVENCDMYREREASVPDALLATPVAQDEVSKLREREAFNSGYDAICRRSITNREIASRMFQAGAEWQRSQGAPAGYRMVPVELLERIISKMSIVWQRTDETEELRALLQAPVQPAQVHGWQMVPIKPTEAMLKAGDGYIGTPATYKAMLSAAPKAIMTEFSQFLKAVMDAAGLVRHGRQSKELSEYLGSQCMKYRLAAAPQPSDDVTKDAARYRWLRKVTPYRFKKIQDASVTDGGDVLYFHADKFDAAIDAAMAGGE